VSCSSAWLLEPSSDHFTTYSPLKLGTDNGDGTSVKSGRNAVGFFRTYLVKNPPMASMPFRKRSMEDFTLGEKYTQKLFKQYCYIIFIIWLVFRADLRHVLIVQS